MKLPSWYHRPLGPGDAGPDVAVLQMLVGVRPDGLYGPVTTSRVRVAQLQAGLDANGRVGPDEARALGNLPSYGQVPSWFITDMSAGMAGDDVVNL